jgi:hypothetical protein
MGFSQVIQLRPLAWTRDDIRRVVSNWPEYGGLVYDRKAKDRPAYEDVNLDEVPLREDRAVFPVGLVRSMAMVRQGRALATAGTAAKFARNEEIRVRRAQGETVSRLADVFGLSPQRISQLVQGTRQ